MNVIRLKFPCTPGGRRMLLETIRKGDLGEFQRICGGDPCRFDWDNYDAAVESIADGIRERNLNG